MKRYNSIIIGAGHNGLVCAGYLARKGQKVLVLEAGNSPGGLAANREFHPGFQASVAHSVSHFSSKVAKDLDLVAHGFRNDSKLPLVGLSLDGNHIRIDGGKLHGAGDDEADSYRDYQNLMRKYARALSPFWHKTMPRIRPGGSLSDIATFAHLGLKMKGLGRKDMLEFLRVFSLPARDLMDENFDNELVKAALSWEGLTGSRMAPRSPNSTVLAMLYRLSEAAGNSGTMPSSKVPGLVEALTKSAEASGVEIRCTYFRDTISR